MKFPTHTFIEKFPTHIFIGRHSRLCLLISWGNPGIQLSRPARWGTDRSLIFQVGFKRKVSPAVKARLEELMAEGEQLLARQKCPKSLD